MDGRSPRLRAGVRGDRPVRGDRRPPGAGGPGGDGQGRRPAPPGALPGVAGPPGRGRGALPGPGRRSGLGPHPHRPGRLRPPPGPGQGRPWPTWSGPGPSSSATASGCAPAGSTSTPPWSTSSWGSTDQALALYDRAQRAYESLGAAGARRAAWVQANRAVTHALWATSAPPSTCTRTPATLFARHGETVAVLRQDQNIAFVYAGLGDYTRALRLLADASAVAERAGLEADAIAGALDHGGVLPQPQPPPRGPATWPRRPSSAVERCGTPTEVAKARVVCAEAHARPATPGGPWPCWARPRRRSAPPGWPARWGPSPCSARRCTSPPGTGQAAERGSQARPATSSPSGAWSSARPRPT